MGEKCPSCGMEMYTIAAWGDDVSGGASFTCHVIGSLECKLTARCERLEKMLDIAVLGGCVGKEKGEVCPNSDVLDVYNMWPDDWFGVCAGCRRMKLEEIVP